MTAGAKAPEISVLLVSYNTRALTLACLDSVFAQTRELDFEVIVVDNASADGSADAVAERFPGVRLLRNARNEGFAAGVNRAAARARGELLLLLNPDTVVLDAAVERLVACARREPARGIWGGRTVFADGRLNPACCWRRITAWGLVCRALGLSALLPGSALFNPEAYGGWARDTVREVDIVQGSFFLVSARLWTELGGFAPEFFMYGEEADFCLRARRAGFRPTLFPEATVVHHGGASEPVAADKQVRLLAARRLLIRRHWRPATAALGLSLLRLGPALRALPARLPLPGAAARRDRWREVWRRRGEWDTDAPSWARAPESSA